MKYFAIRFLSIGCIAASLLSCSGNSDTTQQAVQQAAVPAQPVQTAPAETTQVNAQPAAATSQALPEAITAFVKQYFPNATIVRAQPDQEYQGLEYDVYLNDGTEIDFDANNQWDKVECRASAVPAALIPQAIANYVKNNYRGTAIVKIDKDAYGYDIGLSNGLDVEFDHNGNFLRVDD